MDRTGRQNGAKLDKRGKRRANNPAWGTTKYTELHNQGKRDSMNGQMMESSTGPHKIPALSRWDDSVGTEAGLLTGRSGDRFPREAKDFSLYPSAPASFGAHSTLEILSDLWRV
jgi:hypothetical protein